MKRGGREIPPNLTHDIKDEDWRFELYDINDAGIHNCLRNNRRIPDCKSCWVNNICLYLVDTWSIPGAFGYYYHSSWCDYADAPYEFIKIGIAPKEVLKNIKMKMYKMRPTEIVLATFSSKNRQKYICFCCG